MEDREKIVARVRKLLALAGNNSNEHEAAAAAERAQAILAEYNLTLSEVREEAPGGPEFVFDDTFKTPSRPWRRDLGTMVARLYFCQYFYSFHRHNVPKSQRVCGYIRYDIHNFVGEKHNLIVAKLVFEYLNETIMRLAKDGSRVVPANERTSYQTSFQHACATRLCIRIDKRIRDAKAGNVKSETGTALALLDVYKKAEEQIGAHIKGVLGQALTTPNSRAKILHDVGYRDGREAGDKISLDQQVGADVAKKRIGGAS